MLAFTKQFSLLLKRIFWTYVILHTAYSTYCKVPQSERYPVPLTNNRLSFKCLLLRNTWAYCQKNQLYIYYITHSAYSSLCKVLQSDRYPVPLTNNKLGFKCLLWRNTSAYCPKNKLYIYYNTHSAYSSLCKVPKSDRQPVWLTNIRLGSNLRQTNTLAYCSKEYVEHLWYFTPNIHFTSLCKVVHCTHEY